MATNPRPAAGDPFLLLGTAKGAFVVTGDLSGEPRIAGPYLAGWDVYHCNVDARSGTLLVAASSPVHGPLVARSLDWGSTWEQDATGLEHPQGDGKVTHVWNVTPVGDDWYAGVAEAGLFRSADGGKHWEPVSTLRQHASREQWMPGGGGMCLHTIVADPREIGRLYVAISAAGTFRTDDGGRSWSPRNRGVRADFLPDPDAPVGHCVHKLAMDAGDPAVLYQQNHCGVFRSDDRGDSWTDIGAGLPSRFGFPIVAHRRRSGTLFTVPLEADTRRFAPDGALAVWRSRDAGGAWERCARGLPQRNAYLVVLREAMSVDDGDPCGVFFGTHTGHLFASLDEANTWRMLAGHLPPIRSVEAGRASSW